MLPDFISGHVKHMARYSGLLRRIDTVDTERGRGFELKAKAKVLDFKTKVKSFGLEDKTETITS